MIERIWRNFCYLVGNENEEQVRRNGQGADIESASSGLRRLRTFSTEAVAGYRV